MTAFKIAKAEFLRGVRLARGIAEKKGTMPILANILLRTHGPSGLSLVATDLNVSITAELKSHNLKDGGMLIGAANLFEVVSNAPGDEISLNQADNNWAEIKSGKAKYKIAGMPEKDFPKVMAHRGPTATMESAVLREMIDRVAFAVCEDATRFHLTGAILESDGSEVRMAATDGHRLCRVARKVTGPRLAAGIIIPRKGLGELKKLTEQGASITIAVADNHLFATQDDIKLAVKLIDAVFPNYDAVIPRDHKNSMTIDRVRILDALRRQFMSTDTRATRLDLSAEGATLSCDHPDTGEVSEGLDSEVVGDPVTIGFYPKYVADVLNQMSADQVTIKIGTAVDPIVIVPVSSDDYIGIVMPMRM